MSDKQQNSRILFVALRERDYVRNALAIRALQELGWEVDVYCAREKRYPLRIAVALAHLLTLLPRRRDYKAIYLGFLGHPLALALRIWKRQPIVFDAFVSIFDTICLDRRLVNPSSIIGRLALFLDRFSCRLADAVIVDTQQHANFFESVLNVPRTKLFVVPVGADSVFYKRRETLHPASPVFRVFYYSSNLPVHGLQVVLDAAAILEKEPVVFRIAGVDPSQPGSPKSNNVEFIGWQKQSELAHEIWLSDLCLAGHFSSSPKATRTVPGKAYQFLSMGKPTVFSALPANLLFVNQTQAFFCEPESATSLATVISTAQQDPEKCQQIGEAGYSRYVDTASDGRIRKAIQEAVDYALVAPLPKSAE